MKSNWIELNRIEYFKSVYHYARSFVSKEQHFSTSQLCLTHGHLKIVHCLLHATIAERVCAIFGIQYGFFTWKFSPEWQRVLKFHCTYDNPSVSFLVSGMRLGLMQSKLGLIQILKDHEFSPCEKTRIPMVLDPKALVTTALGGIHLNIRKVTTAAGWA